MLHPAKWWLKKAARAAVGAVPAAGGDAFRVLTYHRFGHAPRDPWTLKPAVFAAQMRFLADTGRGLGPAEAAAIGEHDPAGRGRILVTIDDGHISVWDHAAAILEESGIGAIIYVVGSWIGQPDYLSAAQIRDLAARGFVFGSHAWQHRFMAPLTAFEQQEEAERSRLILQALTGQPVRSFAYPYGTRAAFDARSRKALAGAGYGAAFTSQHGAVAPGDDPLELSRVKVEAGDPAWLFPRLCAGSLDRWEIVDRLGARIQQPIAHY